MKEWFEEVSLCVPRDACDRKQKNEETGWAWGGSKEQLGVDLVFRRCEAERWQRMKHLSVELGLFPLSEESKADEMNLRELNEKSKFDVYKNSK